VLTEDTVLTEDRSLIDRFVRLSDHQAFVTLVDRNLPGMRRLLYGLFRGNREDMEDAEQEIILALYRALPRYRGTASFKTYLFRFCRNRAIDILRKKGRQRRLLQRIGIHVPIETPDPEEIVVNRESKRELLNLLFRLKEEDRALILLKEVEGFTIAEVSQIIRVPEGTVKSRLHRIRARLVSMRQEVSV
jgi:RNA polymerase sigma-70 factor (ECF subfamily)